MPRGPPRPSAAGLGHHRGCTAIPGRMAFLPSCRLSKNVKEQPTSYIDAGRAVFFPSFLEFPIFLGATGTVEGILRRHESRSGILSRGAGSERRATRRAGIWRKHRTIPPGRNLALPLLGPTPGQAKLSRRRSSGSQRPIGAFSHGAAAPRPFGPARTGRPATTSQSSARGPQGKAANGDGVGVDSRCALETVRAPFPRANAAWQTRPTVVI